MTLVLAAMDGELEAIIAGMTVERRGEWHGFRVVQGTVAGGAVVAARTGVGKSLSALVTGYLVERFNPDRILCTGIAGALHAGLEVGDVVIARETLQHDMDASACGFPRGRVPGTRYRELVCDPTLVALARGIDPPSGHVRTGHVRTGRVLTGDRFVDDPAERAALARAFSGDAVEMEGASVGLVAAVYGIPYLVIRTISDGGAPGAASGGKDLGAALCRAAANSWHYVSGMLEALRGEDEQTRV